MIRVGRYPTSLSDDALNLLATIATQRLMPHAPRLAAWFLDVVVEEQARRLRSSVRDKMTEPEMPAIPSHLWTDAEVGEALRCIFAVRNAMAGAGADSFLERVVVVLIGLASSRLERGGA